MTDTLTRLLLAAIGSLVLLTGCGDNNQETIDRLDARLETVMEELAVRPSESELREAQRIAWDDGYEAGRLAADDSYWEGYLDGDTDGYADGWLQCSDSIYYDTEAELFGCHWPPNAPGERP